MGSCVIKTQRLVCASDSGMSCKRCSEELESISWRKTKPLSSIFCLQPPRPQYFADTLQRFP
jgi:hypothetical protein